VLIYAFIALILLGTIFLLMPFSRVGGGFAPFTTALFTATSAVTVTGLTVEHTGMYWTLVGQIGIMLMIFLGGLGYMTFATFLLLMLRRRVSLSHRLVLSQSLGTDQLGDLVRLASNITIVAVAIQVVGSVVLFLRFRSLYPAGEAIWHSVFHSVSAFNNAGFVSLTEPEGMVKYHGDFAILGAIGLLVLLGGISYWVMVDVVRHRRFALFTLNTKLVLVVSAALLFVGTALFFVAEYDNPQTLQPLPLQEKLGIAFFESIMSRTAGFDAIDMSRAMQETAFFLTALMFIGGATGSVAGGIKVNTFGVLMAAVWCILRGRSRTTIFGREIPLEQVMRAMAIITVSVGFIFLVALLLSFSDHGFPFIHLFFETVSAFGTVGLSLGVTGDLSTFGRLLLVVTMLIGRVGPFAIAFAMASRPRGDVIRYANESVNIG
jgi:trk system potassium uptake protein TrkH